MMFMGIASLSEENSLVMVAVVIASFQIQVLDKFYHIPVCFMNDQGFIVKNHFNSFGFMYDLIKCERYE